MVASTQQWLRSISPLLHSGGANAARLVIVPSLSFAAIQRSHASSSAAQASSSSSGKRKGPSVLRDEAIRSQRVRLVDPQTNELIEGPFSTSELLASIDRKRFVLQQVTPGNRPQRVQQQKVEQRTNALKTGNDSSTTESAVEEDDDEDQVYSTITLNDLPIVKLIDKKQEYDRERAAKREKQQQSSASSSAGSGGKKSSGSMHKEVTFTWNSTMHDVRHKLQPMRNNLIKRGPGATCTVIISSKKGQTRVDNETKTTLLRQAEEYLCDWETQEAKDAVAVAATENQQEIDNGIAQSNQSTLKRNFFARRRGDVEWQASERAAMLRIEVVRR